MCDQHIRFRGTTGCARICSHRFESGFQSLKGLEKPLAVQRARPGQCVTCLSPGATAGAHADSTRSGNPLGFQRSRHPDRKGLPECECLGPFWVLRLALPFTIERDCRSSQVKQEEAGACGGGHLGRPPQLLAALLLCTPPLPDTQEKHLYLRLMTTARANSKCEMLSKCPTGFMREKSTLSNLGRGDPGTDGMRAGRGPATREHAAPWTASLQNPYQTPRTLTVCTAVLTLPMFYLI